MTNKKAKPPAPRPQPSPLDARAAVLPALRIALGALFVYSGFSKVVLPHHNFLYVVESYEILNPAIADAVARAFPWIEFLAGVFLLAGLWTRLSSAVLWILNTLFIGVLISALWRKLPIEDCGCFGGGIRLPLPATLAVDIGLWFLFLLVVTGAAKARRFGLDAWLGRRDG